MDKTKEKSKKNLLVIILAILVIAALVVGGVVVYNNFFAEKQKPSNGVFGVISDGWDTGIENKPPQQAASIQIPGYSIAEMKAGDKSLVLSIGNPKDNECGFYATLKLADGTVLYESELIKPGYGLTAVPLSRTLEAGKYTAMVCYRCVTLDEDETPLNSAESEFKLIVK